LRAAVAAQSDEDHAHQQKHDADYGGHITHTNLYLPIEDATHAAPIGSPCITTEMPQPERTVLYHRFVAKR
jgi:hypothetical protein